MVKFPTYHSNNGNQTPIPFCFSNSPSPTPQYKHYKNQYKKNINKLWCNTFLKFYLNSYKLKHTTIHNKSSIIHNIATYNLSKPHSQ